jgi:Tol biopolymer transport system component
VHFFSAPAPPPRLTPLTAYPGEELHPALSPDGEQVAFSWQGENVDESKPPTRHIFLKLVGGSEIRQLTQDVAIDSDPSWSPDGRQIAFIRQSRLFTISPLGGQARKLSDFSVGFFSQLSWTVDGEWIAATHTGVGSVDDPAPGAIHLVSTTGKPPRTLTRPVQGGVDRFPIISPDGRQLAYASCGAGPQGILVLPCRVHVVDVGGSASAAKVLVSKPVSVIGLAWSPDGRSVICSERGPRAALWRLDASGVRPPERIELTVGRRAVGVSISGRRQRLVFSSQKGIYELWALESTGEKRRLLTSPEYLATPSFSPDGRRVAFCSGRSGESIEIWLADGDGTNLTQLTHGPGYWQCMPRWSPDGKRIAFNSMEDDGKRNLWTIDVAGGAPRRMTHGPFGETNGGWFPDGRTMYYRQDHAAGSDVWRLSDNGTPIRLTDKGGSNPLLVPEGDVLLYTRRRLRSALVARRLETGMETELVSCVNGRDFDVGGGGLYYLGCPDMLRGFPLFRMDLATRLTTPLGRLDHDDQDGIAVSPLGWPVLDRKHLPAADLMLIENFR